MSQNSLLKAAWHVSMCVETFLTEFAKGEMKCNETMWWSWGEVRILVYTTMQKCDKLIKGLLHRQTDER